MQRGILNLSESANQLLAAFFFMARGVLIKERVVEQKSRLRDRRTVRDEGDLADPRGAFVGLHDLTKHGLAPIRVEVDDSAAGERQAEAFDERAAMTTDRVVPVRISFPPMITGISTRSEDIEARRALSSARSGDPGTYDLTGSLTATGTLRSASTMATPELERWLQASGCRARDRDRAATTGRP